MAKFINAHVVTYSPQHVLATVNELERLGYTAFQGRKPNFKTIKCIYLWADGDFTMGADTSWADSNPNHNRKLLTIELRGAHDPIKTDSRDRQSVLAVLGSKPISMPLTNSEVVALQEQFIADLQAAVDTSPPPLRVQYLPL